MRTFDGSIGSNGSFRLVSVLYKVSIGSPIGSDFLFRYVSWPVPLRSGAFCHVLAACAGENPRGLLAGAFELSSFQEGNGTTGPAKR